MTILVTGAAGFIGSALVERLLASGQQVVGLDNHNDYYDPKLKDARIERFSSHPNYMHHRIDLCDGNSVREVFEANRPNQVLNLAAQAGVRYSMENPMAYINSNLVGFTNVLEYCRQFGVEHCVYASSSSVYGANESLPFSVRDSVDHPLSLYAATKRANELIAHSYSSLYGLPTTGLRFFTVYGPWGRPDMALFLFARAILNNEPINLFNQGNHQRDFTFVDDVVEAVQRILNRPPTPDPIWDSRSPNPASSRAPWRIYNIGNNNPVPITDYLRALEVELGKPALINLLPLQPGDVKATHADVTELEVEFNFRPSTSVETGVKKFVSWYRHYYRS